jgi:hypothetical protein
MAWAAGIFDGEGTVTWTNSKYSKTLRLSVSQASTDEIPQRLKQAVGLGNVNGPYGPYRGSKKPHFQWNVNGADAHEAMCRLWPFLSSVKRAKYEALVPVVL